MKKAACPAYAKTTFVIARKASCPGVDCGKRWLWFSVIFVEDTPIIHVNKIPTMLIKLTDDNHDRSSS